MTQEQAMPADGEQSLLVTLRLLVDHVPSMLAYWDSDLKCRFANRAYERWFGVDPDGLIGTSIRDLLGPDLYALNELHIQGALRGEEQHFERIVPGPGGIKRYSLADYMPDIVQGKVVGFIVQVTEVTKLKEAQEALRAQIAKGENAIALLRKSELALREAQRLGEIGSWEWEIAPDVVTWSDELFRLFRLPPDANAPSVAAQEPLFTQESWKRLSDTLNRALTSGEPYILELEYVKSDKTTGWMEARGIAVQDEHGKIVKLHGTAMDITARRLMQEARLQRELAEAANRNKTMLLSRVSHELRTPLNGIMGYAQLNLMDPGAGEQQRQRNEVVLRCGRHMLKLIDELLDLANAELGRVSVQCADLDLQEVLETCLMDFTRVAADAHVELINRLAQNKPLHALGDLTRARQVIGNLLSNAIKYNRPNGQVTISATMTDSHIDLHIEDTGIGMTQSQLDRIFTPFERLGAEHTAVEGTGIGLALSHVLAELMGGTILVESQPGKGSRFTFRLARAQ